MSEGAPSGPAEPVKHPVGVLVVLLMAGVSFALSQTLVIPALPDIGRSVHASPSAASWILSGFLLSASIAPPIVGKLGDVYGKGRVLTLTLLLFSAGGVVCALSHSIALLIAGRVIQGVAGGVFPLAFGIVRDTFPPQRAASGLGLISAILGHRRGHRPPVVRGDRRRHRRRVAVLDQPDRAAGGAGGPPPRAGGALLGTAPDRLARRGDPVRGARGHPARGDGGERLGL